MPLVHDDLYLRMCRARDFIAAHHADALKLPEMARAAALSPYHFLRSFQRTFGETPHEFLTRIRIDRAKRLLAQENASVTEVCFDVGFSSLGSFSTLFSRSVGRAPSQYRRLVQVSQSVAHPFIPWCFASRLGPAR